MADDLKGSVGLDVTEFTTGISKLNASVKSVETSFRASAAVIGDWTNSTSGLQERISSLSEKFELQKQKLSILKEAYDQTVASQGAGSKAAESLANKMYSAEKAITSTEKDLGKYNERLEQIQNPANGLKDKLSGLSQAVQLSASKFNAATAGMKNWESSSSGLEAKIQSLNEIAGAQREKVASLESVYKQVASSEGESSRSAQDLAIKLNQEKAALNETESSISDYRGKLEAAQSPLAGLDDRLKAVSQTVQLSESKFRAAASSMEDWGSKSEGLRAKIQSLNEIQSAQKQKMSELQTAYDAVAKKEGSSSQAAVELATKINEVQTSINKTGADLGTYGERLQKVSRDEQESSTTIGKLKKSFSDLAEQSKNTTSKISEHFSNLKSTIAGYFAGIISSVSFKEIADDADAAEKNLSQMSAVLKSTGDASGMTKQQLVELAEAQQKVTTYSAETTEKAENMLLTFTKIGKDVFPQTVKATEDMATSMHMDATQAALQLGKALNDPATGYTKLQRVGVTFTASQVATIKSMEKAGNTAGAQKVILQELEKEYGNSAKAAGDTLPGQIQKMENSIKESGNKILSSLLPIVQKLMPYIVKGVQSLAAEITSHKAQIVGAAQSVANGIKTLFQFIETHGPAVKTAIIAIATSFAAIKTVQGVAGIIDSFSKIKKGINDIKNAASSAKIFEKLFSGSPQATAAMLIIAGIAALAMVIIRNWGPISGFFKNIWSGIKSGAQVVADNVGKFFTSAANLIKSIWGGITGFFSGIWNGITSIFSVVASFFNGVFGAAVSVIKSAWSGITGFFSGIWNGICTVFSAVAAFFSSAFGAAVSVITSAWSGITGFFGGIWNGIKSIFSAVGSFFSGIFGTAAAGIRSAWSGITGFFSGIWKNISGVFASVGSWFGQRFSEAQSAIKTHFQPNAITSHMHSVWTGIQGAFNDVKNWFGTKFEDAKQAIFTHFSPDAVSSKFNEVWDAVQGTFSKLNPFKWGSDLINGIANGIRSAAGAVQNAASWVAGKIRSFLHFSVPDEGPLADADTYGSDFMQLIADSIDENNTKPANATAKAAALISERLKQAKQSVLADVKSLSQEESSLWTQETKALMNSSGAERKQFADEYEEKRYVIRQEIALRREQAVEEIEQIQRVGAMTKKELQAELEDRKQFASNVNSLLDEVKNALKEKYSEEEQAQENAINKSLDKLKNWKTQSEDIINSTYDAKEQALGNEANAATAALQAQLDALDKKDKADSRAETRKGYTDKISDLQSQIAYSHDAYNKAELQKQLEQEQADYQKELNSEATDDKKSSLQDQISAVKDNLDSQKKMLESQKQAELNNITTVYNAKKKSLDNTLTAVKDTYSKMQEDAQLEAEAERMIVDKNQKGIIDLLNSYSDSYKLAGQTLGDKLAEGFKPAIDSIKAMIASINTEISDARASAIDAQAAADRIAATQSVMYSSNSTTRNNSYNISISSPVRQSPSEQTRQAKAAVQRLIFQTT